MSLYGLQKLTVDCSGDEIRTVQSERKEADINSIIARFEKSGMVSLLNKSEPFYGDVSEFDGLQDAFIKVEEANKLFMGMSAEIRSRFGNDPVSMISFLADPANRKEAEDLGMVVPPVVPKAEVSAPPASAPSSPPGGA